MDAKLTIVIPTYNRAPFVDALLSEFSDYQSRGLKFNITLCNNGSPDNTMEIVGKWQNRLHGFKLINHESNLGYDGNLRSGYNSIETDYCWMFGDSYHIEFESLRSILDDVEENKYDAIIQKCSDAMTIPSKEYTNYLELFKEQGWHITNLCSCIIRKDFINQYSLDRYQNTYFLHYGVFMEYLSYKKDILVKYAGNRTISPIILPNLKKTNWMAKPFGVFGRQWFMMIMSLPDTISIEDKRGVIYDHNKYAHIFDPNNVFNTKAFAGKEYKEDYKKYRWYFKNVVSKKVLILDDVIMYIVPSKVCYLINKLYFSFKNINKLIFFRY